MIGEGRFVFFLPYGAGGWMSGCDRSKRYSANINM